MARSSSPDSNRSASAWRGAPLLTSSSAHGRAADEQSPATGPILLRQRRLGQTELRVFPFAISGNVFGWTTDDAVTREVLDAYAGFGGNFIDTADSYASGRSETMIGNWMRDRGNRAEMVVATKVGKSPDHPGVTQRAIAAAVESSLQRLRTDHIDLLYLHVDDPAVPFEETLLAVDELITAGKVRYLGASDHSGNRLVEAMVIAAQTGSTPIAAMQTHYNLVHRREYEGTMAMIARHQLLGVMPRFALAGGFLTGRYRSRTQLLQGRRGAVLPETLTRRAFRILSTLSDVAAEQHVAPATVALAWLLTRPNVIAPVASASKASQVMDLVAAASVSLTRQQVAQLDRVSSFDRSPA